MSVVIVDQDQVAQLLPMNACMEAMRNVLSDLTEGRCILPLRQILWLKEKAGALGMMPAYWDAIDMIGLKAVTFFPVNEGTDLDTHQGAVLLYSAKDGRLLAVIDGTEITAIRTAAVSGVATQLLANEDASRLALIGSGVQARTHLEAMIQARPIEKVWVHSLTTKRAEAFAKEASETHGISVEVADSAQAAVADAQIVCTVTSSHEPVVEGAWLSPGTHINAVGSSVPSARELDGTAVARARLFVDRRESAESEAGDYLLAKAEGAITEGHILGELGEVITRKIDGRRSFEDITLFKSVGVAVEDLAAGDVILKRAQDDKDVTKLELGGHRRGAH